jgi:hypothetical protein
MTPMQTITALRTDQPEFYRSKPLAEIASYIYRDWSKVNYAAQPYLSALASLDSIDQSYGYDSGKSIVLYFLSNASSWRGPIAKAVKAELKRRVK